MPRYTKGHLIINWLIKNRADDAVGKRTNFFFKTQQGVATTVMVIYYLQAVPYVTVVVTPRGH